MMFISSKTCRLALLVLAAASCIAGTATELPEDHHPVLRGNERRLENLPFFEAEENKNKIAVMSGAGMIFTHPHTVITDGDVCADSSFTGLPSTDTTNLDYKLEDGVAYRGGCGPPYLTGLIANATAKTAMHINSEMGGKTFTQGTYFSAPLTVADNTDVTLDAEGDPDAVFLFKSGSYMVTGANTNINLINKAQAKNVVFATAGYATTGASGSTGGSILAGAAITLGEGCEVKGYVLATAAMTAGAKCSLNSESIGADPANPLIETAADSPIVTAIDAAVCPPKEARFACTAGCSDVCSVAAGCMLIAADGTQTACTAECSDVCSDVADCMLIAADGTQTVCNSD
jgi:hypothetical protein